MNKTVLVLRYELGTALRSKSFLIVAFALPLVAVVIFLVASLVRGNGADSPAGPAGSFEMPELELEGYVDPAGLISEIPESVPPDVLVRYPDEASAQQALDAGEIAAYYLIPADYLQQGDLIYINPDYRPLGSSGQDWVMRQTIFANLLGNDPERLARAWPAMELETVTLTVGQSERDQDNPLTFFLPYIVMMIFYMVIIMSASLLLNSVGNEKKNRTLEVLLASISPQELFTGKIIGLGLLGLLQMAIWLGVGYGILRLGGRTLDLPAGFMLPPSILVWGILFFLLGYAVYASLMAGLGALVPNLKEASQAVILVIWPLIIPMLFIVEMVKTPPGAFAIVMSLFPLTSPIGMMTRLAAGSVPWWHLALAVVLLAATAIFIVRAVGRMFRAQTLLSGQPFTPKRWFAALLGRL